MIEIMISQEWKEEFEHMEQALFYVNALLELIRRQSAEPYPEQFNSELIYENKIVNKKEIEQLIGKRLSKYKIIKL